MTSRARMLSCAAALLFGTSMSSSTAFAAIASDAGAIAAPAAASADLPVMPENRTVKQRSVIAGKAVNYDVTVGNLPIRDEHGKVIAQVVYTAYTMPGAGSKRPVTFAINGGSGGSSAYLNLGAIGPKRVRFGAQGDAPSDQPILTDNPDSWLDFTDIIFLDPVGTGFSRSLEDAAKTAKDFYGIEPDVKYLSRIVWDWLSTNQRLQSPKYIVGESYGGYRAPRIAYELQTQLGAGVNGLILVSPLLDPIATSGMSSQSPLPWIVDLPSLAASKLERDGNLTPERMASIETYARGAFATDLLAGRSDPGANARLVKNVTELTGLDPALVRSMDGRVDSATFLREFHRADRKLGSRYDSNVTSPDPFPAAARSNAGDPVLNALIAPLTSAIVDFMTRTVGWKFDGRYYALSWLVSDAWDRTGLEDKPVIALRQAMANDPRMGVMIAHGYTDLSCPYFGSKLIVDQMPEVGDAQRVRMAVYPGGHMFYNRPESSAAFREDARKLYAAQNR